MNDPEDLVRRMLDAHNKGGDAVVVQARSTARGRVSGASVEEDISLVYWCEDSRLIRGEAFRSHPDALQAAHA